MNIDFAKGGGLVPVIVQHATTGELLMLGYGNEESMRRSLATRELWLYSRTTGELWHKGDTSGNTHAVVSVSEDCDHDAVLLRVQPHGPTCHTGARSCFGDPPTLRALADVIEERVNNPRSDSYTVRLLNDANLRLKKLGEEAVELSIACSSGDTARVANEAADLIYHVLVAVRAAGVDLDDVLDQLEERRF